MLSPDFMEQLDTTAEQHLGAVATIFAADEENTDVAQLLATATLTYDVHDADGYDPWDVRPATARITIPPNGFTSYNLRWLEREIFDHLKTLVSTSVNLVGIVFQPANPPRDWRQQIISAGDHGGPVNQAAIAPLPEIYPQADGMRFRDTGEMLVYEAFKRRQLHQGDVTVAPNAAVRLPGRTLEADFIVLHRGRAGVMEVDGTTHRGRYASDASRDKLFLDAGIHFVEHVCVEDVNDAADADLAVDGFLRRMTK
jgi:hypothetical protein